MKIWLFKCFIAGCVILAVCFAIGWANPFKFDSQTQALWMQTLAAILGVVVLSLAVMSVMRQGKERWATLAMIAVLLLAFSALIFFSIGFLIAPIGLGLLGFSVWKFSRLRVAHRLS